MSTGRSYTYFDNYYSRSGLRSKTSDLMHHDHLSSRYRYQDYNWRSEFLSDERPRLPASYNPRNYESRYSRYSSSSVLSSSLASNNFRADLLCSKYSKLQTTSALSCDQRSRKYLDDSEPDYLNTKSQTPTSSYRPSYSSLTDLKTSISSANSRPRALSSTSNGSDGDDVLHKKASSFSEKADSETSYCAASYSDNQSNSSDIGTGATGLINMGNTCFMNSILQCLSHTVKIRDYALASKYKKQENRKSPLKGKLIRAFADLLKHLWSGSRSSVTPTNFKSQIQKLSSRFAGHEQQDSQEFLRLLLDGLHQDINQVPRKPSEPLPHPLPDLSDLSPTERARQTWKWYETKDKSFVFDLFVGQLQSSLECDECGHVSLTFDPFWDLSLPVPKARNTFSDSGISLEECLERFTREEILDGEDMPRCRKCKVRRKMKKKLLIHRFPEILVIHMKRFNEGVYYRQKLTRLVTFPAREPLDLAPFATDICEDKPSSMYQLFAVSNHSGSCYGGHYTAYCKSPETKEWHKFDDSIVSGLSENSVCSSQAYVLFYMKETPQVKSNES